MKFQAHRGVCTECPENTIPAFERAIEQGYSYIETDTRATKDDIWVLMHDETLNRTCRNGDGTELTKPVKLSEITYKEMLNYDAGIVRGNEFKGTLIPTLAQLLNLAKQAEITVKLDNIIQFYTDEQLKILFNLVVSSKATVAFTCSSIDFIKKILDAIPDAEIHYDGLVNAEIMEELSKVLKDNYWVVWMCLPSAAKNWFKLPRASDDLCALVRSYTKLGLWIFELEEQLKEAEHWKADLIETDGTVKP